MSDEVLLEIKNCIAKITFNRPESLNAMNDQFAKLLIKFCTEISLNENIRCILLQGNGDHFCAGGDVKMFSNIIDLKPDERRKHYSKFLKEIHLALLKLINHPAPIVAAVNGAAAGFGLSFVLLADMAIASQSSKFSLAYSQIGLSPDGSSTFFLPRLLGLKKAKELAFLGDRFDALEALDLGIVNKVVGTKKQLDQEIIELSNRLANSPSKAIGMTKKLLNNSFNSSIIEQFEAETECFANSTATEDFVEGVLSFIQKRTPKFEGK